MRIDPIAIDVHNIMKETRQLIRFDFSFEN